MSNSEERKIPHGDEGRLRRESQRVPSTKDVLPLEECEKVIVGARRLESGQQKMITFHEKKLRDEGFCPGCGEADEESLI